MSEHVVFVAHPSGHLTDYIANGDGLIAHGFLSRLAARGYELHVAVDQITLRQPFPDSVSLYPLRLRSKKPGLRLLECSLRMRFLFARLKRKQRFGLILQMNPVYPGISLSLLGVRIPLILGTYVPRWSTDPHHAKDAYTSASGYMAKLRNLIVGLQQKQAQALLVTTQAAIDRIPWYKANQHKVFEIPHGVDEARFHPAEQHPFSCDCDSGGGVQRILFLASVSERKGIFDLLQAFSKVVDAVPGARLTIAGVGADLEQARTKVAREPWRESVSFLGSVPREDTPAVYRSHDLYCLPSYGEPYATTLLEAMSCGLPIVSTTTGGTPYLVPGDGGILVAPGDPEQLGAAIVRILQDRSLQQAMGRVNREAVLARYAWDKVIDRLEEIYYIVTRGRVGRRSVPASESTSDVSVQSLQGSPI